MFCLFFFFKHNTLTETWLSNKIYNSEIFPSDYAIYRSDRGSRGGGVLFCVSTKLLLYLILYCASIDLIVVETYP